MSVYSCAMFFTTHSLPVRDNRDLNREDQIRLNSIGLSAIHSCVEFLAVKSRELSRLGFQFPSTSTNQTCSDEFERYQISLLNLVSWRFSSILLQFVLKFLLEYLLRKWPTSAHPQVNRLFDNHLQVESGQIVSRLSTRWWNFLDLTRSTVASSPQHLRFSLSIFNFSRFSFIHPHRMDLYDTRWPSTGLLSSWHLDTDWIFTN